MSLRRKKLNISLIILTLILGAMAVYLNRQPALFSEVTAVNGDVPVAVDSIVTLAQISDTTMEPVVAEIVETPRMEPVDDAVNRRIEVSDIGKVELSDMLGDHPFKAEAKKVLSGRLEEADSMSRRRILSYCEHLRTAYTTRDIDFIRQVFSDNALIIVGHVVRNGPASNVAGMSDKVIYSVRTKHDYVRRLAKIFASEMNIDVGFSDFSIMRHPTAEDIYGVTLRQHYTAGNYSDDGYLFLLWDFRDRSMPLIHVRTWQPAASTGDDDLIDLSDFNLN